MKDHLADLRALLGDKGLLTDQAEMAGYAIDWRKLFPGQPLAVARPSTTQEVSAVMASRLAEEPELTRQAPGAPK